MNYMHVAQLCILRAYTEIINLYINNAYCARIAVNGAQATLLK